MNTAPDLEERYITAGRSSNLKCETRDDAPAGHVAILIASGWSIHRIGAALMRLHTKADRSTLEQVHTQLSMQAKKWGVEHPDAVAAAVLGWWLKPTCKPCSGLKFELVPGTPVLSARHCKACYGTGEDTLPYGDAGKRLLEMIERCVTTWRMGMPRRLRRD